MVKKPPANAGDAGDSGSIPGSGSSPGEGNGNPLRYSCLGNPMDRGGWQATVRYHCVSTHTDTHTTICMPLYVTALASRLKSLQISLHLQEYLFM